MKPIQVSTIIQRPLADVFKFAANFENLPQWETDFKTVERLSTGASTTGSQFRAVLKMPGSSATSTITLTGWVPNQLVAFEGEPVGPMKPVGSFVFEAVPGGTKVTARPTPEPRGLFKLMAPMMAGYIEKLNQVHLANLKRLLEG